MNVWKTVTLLHALTVLPAECDSVFGSDEVSSSSSASKFANQVEAADVATQNEAGGNALVPTNSTSLFTTSLLASTNASAASNVAQEDTTQQVSAVTTTSASSESMKQTLTSSTSSATLSVLTALLEATTSLLPNWVGTVDPSDDACYRKTYLSSTCSTGYAYDNIATCWAQCPLNYPVQCGMECIPQNADCALEVIDKIESVAKVALNAATSGIFGQLSTASAAVQQGVKCGQKLFTVVEDIVDYTKWLQTSFPNGTEEQIISLLNNSDIVVKDLLTAVCVCLGLDVPTDYLNLASEVVSIIDKVLIQVVEKGSSLLSVDTFRTLISAVGAGSSLESLDEDDTSTLEKLISEGIRTALSLITDNLVASSDDDSGNALSTADYTLKVIDMGLDVIAMFDPTGIAAMFEEYIQPVCGSTSFMGEIDDGSLADALALAADGDAFADSYGTWTHAGNGAVDIVFESTDTEDVTVEIHSAGETVDSVQVKSGQTMTWNLTVSALQDKTMYLDRWRPGLLGLPGSGGGSLVQWVPRSSEGGHIALVAKINIS